MVTSNRTENSGIINLTCSSVEGYPAPKEMYFKLKTENSTTKYDTAMKKSQSNVTELYNVSISLSFSVPEASNVSITCVLKLETMELHSLPYNIGKAASQILFLSSGIIPKWLIQIIQRVLLARKPPTGPFCGTIRKEQIGGLLSSSECCCRVPETMNRGCT